MAINTTGTAAAAANLLEVTQPAGAANNSVGIFASHLGTAVNAYAIWAAATGATNKYAIVVPSGGGSVGFGTTTPTEILDVNGNVNVPLSTTTVGVIKSNGDRYIHNFGTENFFAGVLAGNLTQSGSGNTAVGYQAFKDATSSYGSTFFGAYAGWKINSGAQNTGFGHSAFGNATTQGGSTAIGYESQQNNGGQYTSSLGHRSLKNNTADYITGVGASALENNTGNYNVAVGYYALKNNSSGANNTALGTQALEDNTTTSGNTAVGRLALWKNTGTENTGLGYNVMNLKTTGSYNVAVGSEAMSLNSGQDESVALGYRSNLSNTGDYNTSVGAYTLAANTSPASNNNTAVGHSALRTVTSGAGNTALGVDAGFAGTSITTGSNNTFIGYGAQASSASLSNAAAIGYNASVAINNAMVLGNGVKVGIGTSSPSVNLHVFSSADDQPEIRAENSNATGLNAGGFIRVAGDAANMFMGAHGSARTLSRYGITLGGFTEITSWSGTAGMIIGTSGVVPVIFGTSNYERMRLLGNGTLKLTAGATNPTTSPGIWMESAITAAAGTAYGILSRGTLTAAANNDAFIPFSNSIGVANTGTFTGLTFYGAQLDGNSWTKTGTGTITNSYGAYVTATPSTFATNNYAAVFTGGHVGIGTTSPAAGLDIVYGGVVSSSASKILHSGTAALNPGTALRVSNGYPAAGGNYEVFGVYGNSFGTNYFSVVDNGRTYLTAVNEQYGLGVKYVSTGGAVYFGAKSGVATPDAVISNAGGATLMTLQNGGNVGIGTTAPVSRLEVANTAGGYVSSNYLQITGTTADNLNYPGFSMKGGTLATTYPSISLTNGGLGAIIYSGAAAGFPNQMFGLFDAGGSFIQFGKVGSPYMTINSTGDIGIGTSTPSQKLEVNGGVLLNTATAQPACAAGTRGLIWFVQGGAGVKDRCEVCAKDAANAYAWRVLY